MSQYYREVIFETEPFKAFGKMVISTTGDPAPAILHELLHLRVALRHKSYALYFTPGTINNHAIDYVMALTNIIEHDLFIDEFLTVGYEKSIFSAIRLVMSTINVRSYLKKTGIFGHLNIFG